MDIYSWTLIHDSVPCGDLLIKRCANTNNLPFVIPSVRLNSCSPQQAASTDHFSQRGDRTILIYSYYLFNSMSDIQYVLIDDYRWLTESVRHTTEIMLYGFFISTIFVVFIQGHIHVRFTFPF